MAAKGVATRVPISATPSIIPSICSQSCYEPLLPLRGFQLATHWCHHHCEQDYTPPSASECPYEDPICELLAKLMRKKGHEADVACACIGHGPASLTISVPHSTSHSTTHSSTTHRASTTATSKKTSTTHKTSSSVTSKKPSISTTLQTVKKSATSSKKPCPSKTTHHTSSTLSSHTRSSSTSSKKPCTKTTTHKSSTVSTSKQPSATSSRSARFSPSMSSQSNSVAVSSTISGSPSSSFGSSSSQSITPTFTPTTSSIPPLSTSITPTIAVPSTSSLPIPTTLVPTFVTNTYITPSTASVQPSATSAAPVECVALANPPTTLTCGESGFFTGESSIKQISTGSSATLEDCADTCSTTANCVSFGYSGSSDEKKAKKAGESLGVCNLYKYPISQLSIVTVEPVGGQALQTFYDIGCYDCTTLPAPTSSSGIVVVVTVPSVTPTLDTSVTATIDTAVTSDTSVPSVTPPVDTSAPVDTSVPSVTPSDTSVPSVSPPVPSVTPTVTPPDPVCSESLLVGDDNYYVIYYSGTGHTLNPDNPANDSVDNPPFSGEFDGTLPQCGVLNLCAGFCNTKGGEYGFGYYSFDLHHLISRDVWVCVCYDGSNDESQYFNVVDPDVSVAYGYDIGDP